MALKLLLLLLFFLFVGCQQTKQIAHVMNLNQDYISKGKVTSANAYFIKSNAQTMTLRWQLWFRLY